MAEVTRVPLQPLKKGSLAKLWLGVFAVILAGAALAWFTVPVGVSVREITPGLGESPARGDVAFVKYVGKLEDGTEFDRSRDLQVPIPDVLPEGTPMLLDEGATIAGFVDGVVQMQKGGKYTLYIPAEKGYGDSPPPDSPIPANADLVFEIELVDFMSRQDWDQTTAMLQQMLQMQQQAAEGDGESGGGAGDAPPTAEPAAR